MTAVAFTVDGRSQQTSFHFCVFLFSRQMHKFFSITFVDFSAITYFFARTFLPVVLKKTNQNCDNPLLFSIIACLRCLCFPVMIVRNVPICFSFFKPSLCLLFMERSAIFLVFTWATSAFRTILNLFAMASFTYATNIITAVQIEIYEILVTIMFAFLKFFYNSCTYI